MSRTWQFGQVLMTTDETDHVDLGYNPEDQRARVVTRSLEHVRKGRGSLISIEMTIEQLRALVVAGAHVLDLVDRGRTPGDSPLPPMLEQQVGTNDVDATVTPPKAWKGNA